MKYLVITSLMLMLSSSSFAAYICNVKGMNKVVGLADRDGGGTSIYIQGSGYYKITSVRQQKYYSVTPRHRVLLDLGNKVLEFKGETFQLTGCRGAGE